jgi:hypothetical protein
MLALTLLSSLLLSSIHLADAATVWQQKNYTFSIPATPNTTFTSNFTSKASALSVLQSALGNGTIGYPGDLKYGETIARVWTKQRKTYPEAIIYPQTPEQVSIIMKFYSNAHALWGTDGFAIMGGGHADFGGAQSPSVIVDLQSGLDSTTLATNPPVNGSEYAILKIGGGSDAGDVYNALDGTGWAFLGPRAASIGKSTFLFETNQWCFPPPFTSLPPLNE